MSEEGVELPKTRDGERRRYAKIAGDVDSARIDMAGLQEYEALKKARDNKTGAVLAPGQRNSLRLGISKLSKLPRMQILARSPRGRSSFTVTKEGRSGKSTVMAGGVSWPLPK